MHVWTACVCHITALKEPVWHEVGTHIGIIGRRVRTPTNISDGFYYVPLLLSLKALLGNPSILHQVSTYIIISTIQKLKCAAIMLRLYQAHINVQVNSCLTFVMVQFLIPTVFFVKMTKLYKLLLIMMSLH